MVTRKDIDSTKNPGLHLVGLSESSSAMGMIHGDRWFQIETCSTESGKPEITSYFVNLFSDAQFLLGKVRKNSWSTLKLYARLPILIPSGFIFEEVHKVFQIGSTTILFLMDSGQLLIDCPQGITESSSFIDAKEIYSRYRKAKENTE